MVEEGPGSVENDLPAAEPAAAVTTFQLFKASRLSALKHRLSRAGDETWREALRLELEARAARLHQAVDAAIVLSNDGIIRWLGDPVAKLSLGPNALNPSAVIFADESLPDASRETIKTRIELWIAATTRRLLAPLFALEGLQEGSEIVRDLAHGAGAVAGGFGARTDQGQDQGAHAGGPGGAEKARRSLRRLLYFSPRAAQARRKNVGPSTLEPPSVRRRQRASTDPRRNRLVWPDVSPVGQGDLEGRVSRRRLSAVRRTNCAR